MQRRARHVLVAIFFFAALMGIGLASVTSSEYKDVSSLRDLRYDTQAIVRGEPVSLGARDYYMRIGETVFHLRGYGSYGVAERVEGPMWGDDDSYAVFLLRGSDGYTIVALYSARVFTSIYGSSPSVAGEVVVEGLYMPTTRAVIIDPASGSSAEYSVFAVTKILEGCHESYEAPAGRIEAG